MKNPNLFRTRLLPALAALVTAGALHAAPTPDPMTFDSAPAAVDTTTVTMTATTATDPNGVEYYFTETSGNPGGADSGWQASPTYTDVGLTPGTTYSYNVKARDAVGFLETAPSTPDDSATTVQVPPTPDPMTFDVAPLAVNETRITMTATTASHPEAVEYFFTETSGNPGGDDSGWQSSPVYTDDGLQPGTTYSYNVKARESAQSTETAASSDAPATTDPDNGTEEVIYEPFNYPIGGLNGASGPYEKGLDGTWSANGTSLVVAGSLEWGTTLATLPTVGNSIGALSGGQNRFGGSRSVSSAALDGNGLLNDGATLWFSAMMGYDAGGNRTNSRLVMVLGDAPMNSGNFNYWFNNAGETGLGVTVGRFSGGNGRIVATEVRDSSFGDGFAGNVFGTGQTTTILPGSNATTDAVLVVGKITWAEDPTDPDLVELFLPDTDQEFPDPFAPHSSLSVTVDQSGYDTITWSRGDKMVMDEIRFGASYNDVIAANVVVNPDTEPPLVGDPDTTTPSPFQATFAVLPTAIDDSTVTMTATTAHDPSGVEYLFTETTGNPGATTSGWQDSPNYTDVGLSPETMYTYTVQTRDKSVGQNTGTPSAGEDVTTPAVDFDPPTPNPMTFAVNPAAISNTEITMTATTATDNTYGVEYLFTNTTLATNSGWQASPTYTATGLTPSTSYMFTVTARDTGPLQNAGTPSAAESASTLDTDDTPPSPDPSTWDVVPTATSDTEVTMTATTATDLNGVEYFFTNLSVPDGSHDSGWQASPTYTDTGLNPFSSYTYQVTVRDMSYARNESVKSDPLPAVTAKPAGVVDPTLLEGLFYTIGSQNNSATGPTPSTDVDVSVFPGKAIYSGVGNWPNQNQNGSWFIYNHFGDGTVADYKFFAEDGTSGVILNYAAGAGGIIADVTTADTNVDDAPWADVWTAADPGFDFLANPADFTSDTFMTQVVNTGGLPAITGTIDISGMSEGIVYILYGAYRNRPNIDVTMSGPGQTDVVLENIGDDDSANNNENYACSFSFFNAENYDTISFDYNSTNGRFLGVVVDGEIGPALNDYDNWAALFPGADLSDPNGDFDGDGVTNNEERLFGTDPTDAASLHQFPSGLFASTTSTFSFTRRDNALTGLFSDIETSFDLQMWTEDIGAVLVEGTVDGSTMVEIVEVTLSPGLLTAPKLFVRVNQNEGVFISENFEADDGGFTVVTTAGTDWEHGAPDSVGEFGGSVTEGNGGSTNCWATNLGDVGSSTSPTDEQRGYYADSTITSLRSTVIDLTGVAAAELLFAEAMDIETGDTAVVNIIDDTTDTVISSAIYTADDSTSTGDANWNNVGPIAIPAGALGQAVRIEWRFTGFGGATDDYLGWYIDDVTVRRVMP